METSAHILVVEDEDEIAALLARYFKAQGYTVSTAGSGAAARQAMAAGSIDLVLLDLGLPGEDGLALMRSLRESSNVAVIVVTGRGDAVDRIVGLEIGADDYVTKPFDLRELAARARSVLRRTQEPSRPAPKSDARPRDALRFAGWTLHIDERRLESPQGQTVEMTTGEFELLVVLAREPGRVFTRDELLAATRHRASGPYDRTIDVQIGRLRRKIEADSQRPQIVKSVRGAGYVLTPKVEKA